MSAKLMAILAWSAWGVLLAALLVAMVAAFADRQHSPEVSRGLGPLVIGVLLLLHLGLGGLLYWLHHTQSRTGLVIMMAVLALPILVMVARPAVMAFKTWSFERDEARIGDFRDPAASAIAQAVRAGDCAGLTRLLASRPLPDAVDRAGNDILAYSLAQLRDGNGQDQGSVACVRALLEAGFDPRTSRSSDGQDVLNFILLDPRAAAGQALLLLLEHGADPNAVDPITGETPIRKAGHDPALVRALVDAGAEIDHIQPDGVTALVDYVSSREWESAIYLIERGARLDVSNDDGLSLAYFQKSWEVSVYGENPEGWLRVKQAIAERGGTAAPDAGTDQ